jgi:hypothetical protein
MMHGHVLITIYAFIMFIVVIKLHNHLKECHIAVLLHPARYQPPSSESQLQLRVLWPQQAGTALTPLSSFFIINQHQLHTQRLHHHHSGYPTAYPCRCSCCFCSTLHCLAELKIAQQAHVVARDGLVGHAGPWHGQQVRLRVWRQQHCQGAQRTLACLRRVPACGATSEAARIVSYAANVRTERT